MNMLSTVAGGTGGTTVSTFGGMAGADRARAASASGASGSTSQSTPAREAKWAAGEMAVATIGEACDRPSLQSCARHASTQRAECDGKQWVTTVSCPSGQFCDSTTEGKKGSCQQAVKPCADKKPDSNVCDGNKVLKCGADLVTVMELKTCSGPMPVCRRGECGCQFECNGQCADLEKGLANCGACGHSCGNSTCEFGVCTPAILATATGRFDQVVADSKYIYYTEFSEDVTKPWSATSTAKLKRMGLDGSNATELSVDSNDSRPPIRFVIDATYAYWIVGDGSLRRVPLAGGPSTNVSGANVANTLGIAVSDGFVYYNGPGGSIVKLSVDGGMPAQVVASGVRAYQMVADKQSLYWTDAQAGTVNKVPLSGGAPVVLASAQVDANEIAVDSTHVYWTEGVSQAVRRVPLTGGTWTPVAEAGASSSLVLDEHFVYFATSSFVVRVARENGQPEGLATGIMYGFDLTGTADALFVTTHGTPSQLIKVSKGPPPPMKP